MDKQLNLLPEKPITPKPRKVLLSELPELIPGAEPERAFIRSIERFGVLQPVGLIETRQGFAIAFGRRRIKAARQLKMIAIPAYIYPAGWTAPQVLTLVENQQRRDNLVAKLEAVESLRLQATVDEICLATGMTKPELGKALKLIDGLIPGLRQALAEGRMATGTAHKVLRLTPEQQMHLAELDTIKAKDVDKLQRVNTTHLTDSLPDFLFEETPVLSWQTRADKLIAELLETVPEESELYRKVQQLVETVTAKAA